MREDFSDELVRIGQANPRMLLLTGDHGYALFDRFRKECPTQYINAGIAEQNMVGMAAGLARAGFLPFVYGLSAFIPVRVIEQIKLDIAHDNLRVVLIGDGAGFVYSHLGTSHQSTEDIACTRAIPQLTLLSPADKFELSRCMSIAAQNNGPTYLRLGKADRGSVHSSSLSSEIGKLIQVRPGQTNGMAFIATGSMVTTAVNAAEDSFKDASVWSAMSIKPLDAAQIESICRTHRAVVTLEEHSIYGGLGSLISEIASAQFPTRILRIGVNDRFSEYCGTYDYLLTEHGLDLASVKAKINDFASKF